jgi:uncharacterized membrane protein
MMTSDVEVDDAPPTTSKRDDAVEVAKQQIPAAQGDVLVGRSVTINRPTHELYAYWRDFTNLATFMENIERIDVIDRDLSHWVVKAPGGTHVEWDARVTEEHDGKVIAWTSENADVANSGRVEFKDAGARGTVVTATLLYDPPAGVIGKIVAKLFQREPNVQARRDLRRFKQLMETGEIAVAATTRAKADEEKN